MSHLSGTTLVTVKNVSLTQGEDYLQAEGEAIFSGQTLKAIAFGKAAEALNANQNVELTVTSKIFGGSAAPYIKIEQVVNASAPATAAIDDETVANLKQVLKLKSKATRKQMLDAAAAALALLEN